MVTTVDLDALALELGITRERVAEHIESALDAGFLKVVQSDSRTVTLAAAFPDEQPTRGSR